MEFLKNCWYMAGWSDELPAGTLLARTFLEQPVVLFRQGNGTPVALLDRCPHRVAPLSRGTLVGDTLRCIYHGLRFDTSGRCVENPHGAIPAKACVPGFPLAERDGIIWIWMGEPAAADRARAPDLAHMARVPATAQSRGSMPSACHYQLIVDNVADLSHVEYLHATTLGGGAFVENRPVVSEQGTDVVIELRSRGQAAPPVYDRFLPQPGVPVDFVNRVTWSPAGLLKLDISVAPLDAPPETGLRTFNAHIVTPETRSSSHYWYWLTREYRQEDADMTQLRHALMTRVFVEEDKPIIEAQQRLLGGADLFDAQPVLLATDTGSIRIRRIMRQLLAQEAAPAA